MAYNKTTWKDGDTITAEKLNKLENGVESADNPIVIIKGNLSVDGGDIGYSCTTTYNQLLQWHNAGKIIIVQSTINNSTDSISNDVLGISSNYFVVNKAFNAYMIGCSSSEGWAAMRNNLQ